MATAFHFLFVPLTLGLSVLIAIMETIYAKTGDRDYQRMARFWGKLFLINFAIGVVTGITLEFQFGTNWARYSRFVGDIFGSLLAIEALAAFFLESTFIAVWAYGWKKLTPKAHAAVMWVVAFASSLSAIWILTANAWMQHPVGYVIRNGRAEITDFIAVITQRFAILEILHTVLAAYVLGGFFVLGVCAWHFRRNNEVEFFRKCFRLTLIFTTIAILGVIIEGDMHGYELTETQPAKLAAMEAHWDTSKNAPMVLFAIADERQEKNLVEIGRIPNMLSFLATHTLDGEVKGLKDFPADERPPVMITFYSFRIMVGLGFAMAGIIMLAWIFRKRIEHNRFMQLLLMMAVPMPYIAAEFGWAVAEVGRQPWVVYGVMKTADAVSKINAEQVMVSFVAFFLLYSLLGAVDFYLLYKFARKGPDPASGQGVG